MQTESSSKKRKNEPSKPAYDRVRPGATPWITSLTTGASQPLSSQEARQRLKGVAERLPYRVSVRCEDKHGLFLGGGDTSISTQFQRDAAGSIPQGNHLMMQ